MSLNTQRDQERAIALKLAVDAANGQINIPGQANGDLLCFDALLDAYVPVSPAGTGTVLTSNGVGQKPTFESGGPEFGPWIALTLINGWVDNSGGGGSGNLYTPAYRTNGVVVQLRGGPDSPAAPNAATSVMAVLPVTARPGAETKTICNSENLAGPFDSVPQTLSIRFNGEIVPGTLGVADGSHLYYLDGVEVSL